jgi:hypothetical protein
VNLVLKEHVRSVLLLIRFRALSSGTCTRNIICRVKRDSKVGIDDFIIYFLVNLFIFKCLLKKNQRGERKEKIFI